jgi:flagellar protein FliL
MANAKGGDAANEKKSGGKVKWIILLLLLLLLAGGGAAAYWFLLGPGAGVEENVEGDEEAQDQDEEAKQESTRQSREIVTLEPFIVNLADPLGRRFLRMTLDVEVVSSEAADDVRESASRIRDAIIMLLSSKAYSDLASMENKIMLKTEIVDRLGQIMGKGRVGNVYFTEFVIQ